MSAQIIDVMARGDFSKNREVRAALFKRNPMNLRKLLAWERTLEAARKRVACHWWNHKTVGCA